MDDIINATDEKDQSIAELEENWKRALADYKNLERRVSEEKDVLIKFANFVFIERLIPVLDNLETLATHVKDGGLTLIVKQLTDLLKDDGVEEVRVLGEEFDPSEMEASETVEGDDGKVVEVVRKGYKMQDKILRPARVKVGKRKE